MRIPKPNIDVDDTYLLLAVFAVAFAIRGLPELLSGPYPVGYDLLAGYAPSILAIPETFPLRLFGWLWSSLAVFIIWSFWKVSQIDLFLLLKTMSPIFYGFFIASFYYMLNKGLNWKRKASFFTALILLLQPAILRTGWDQLRLMLSLIFFFVLLAKTKCDFISGSEKKPLTVIVLSFLIIASQQLTSVLLFVVFAWQMAKAEFKNKKALGRALFVFCPSVILFALQLYFTYIAPSFNPHFAPINLPSGTNFFVFTNYFISDARFIDGDYWRILLYVSNLALYTVVPLILPACKGFFKDKVFLPMLVWLLAASYSIIVVPWFAFSNYWFWTFLLPIPLTIYAGHALQKSGIIKNKTHSKKLIFGFLLLGIIGIGYSSSIISVGYPFAYSYMPPGLVKSCVDFEDIKSIQEAFNWVNVNLPTNAVVVVPEKFQGFASMYCNPNIKIHIAPPSLVNNTYLIETVGEINDVFFEVFYLSEVGEYKGINVLSEFGKIGVFQINVIHNKTP